MRVSIPRPWALAAAMCAVTLALGGCIPAIVPDDERPVSPEVVLGQLAGALSEHSLDGVVLAEPSKADQFGDQIAPLEQYSVEVTAGEIRQAGSEATGTLRWSWQVHGRDWTYDSTASLVDNGDGWVVAWDPTTLVPSLGAHDVLKVDRAAAERGDILGAGGAPLVTPRPVLRYGLDKTRVSAGEVGRSAARIARELGIDTARFREAAGAAGPEAFVEALVLREEEARVAVAPSFADIPGALALPDLMPLAPTREFAAEIIGRVGPATAEIVEESDGRVSPSDVVGLSGASGQV